MEELKFENFKPLTNNELNKIYGGKRVKTGANAVAQSTGDVQKFKNGELVWTKYYYY